MEYEYDFGPESPADLEWSQGAKNTRINFGTLDSDTYMPPDDLIDSSKLIIIDSDDSYNEDEPIQKVKDPIDAEMQKEEDVLRKYQSKTVNTLRGRRKVWAMWRDNAKERLQKLKRRSDFHIIDYPNLLLDWYPNVKDHPLVCAFPLLTPQLEPRQRNVMPRILFPSQLNPVIILPNALPTAAVPRNTSNLSLVSQKPKKKKIHTLAATLVRFPKLIKRLKCYPSLTQTLAKNPLKAILVNEMSKNRRFKNKTRNEIIDALWKKLVAIQKVSVFKSIFVPKFDNYQIVDSLPVFTCADEASLLWLQNINRSILKGNGLIISSCWLGKLITVKCSIPLLPPFGINDALILLRKQNSQLNVSQWQVLSRKFLTDQLDITFRIDEGSLNNLKTLDMRPFFGLSRIEFEIIDSDSDS